MDSEKLNCKIERYKNELIEEQTNEKLSKLFFKYYILYVVVISEQTIPNVALIRCIEENARGPKKTGKIPFEKMLLFLSIHVPAMGGFMNK